MEIVNRHRWPDTLAQARKFVADAARRVRIDGNTEEPGLIAAVDTAYGHQGTILYAAAVIFEFPALTEVERQFAEQRTEFPYQPGLFYFREGPVLLDVLSKVESRADLILLPSHGIAHPKRCGLACHVGIVFDKPTVGCARKILAGDHRPVDTVKGSSQPVSLCGSEVGLAYRSKDNVKPIFISPGHRCDLAYAKKIVIRCLRGYRLPEPLRRAHLLANKHKAYHEKGRARNSSEPV